MLILPPPLWFARVSRGEQACQPGLFYGLQMRPVMCMKKLRIVGGVYPDRRHVLVWHWVGWLHHLTVLMAMHSSVLTQRQRGKTIIRGN